MHDVSTAHLFELNEPGFGELDGSTLSDSLDGHQLALVQRQRREQLGDCGALVVCRGQRHAGVNATSLQRRSDVFSKKLFPEQNMNH